MNESEIAKLVENDRLKEVVLQFTDLAGILHSLWIPSDLLLKVAESGLHTDGSSFSMVNISESDLKLKPDLSSFVLLPSALYPQKVGRVVCNIFQPE